MMGRDWKKDHGSVKVLARSHGRVGRPWRFSFPRRFRLCRDGPDFIAVGGRSGDGRRRHLGRVQQGRTPVDAGLQLVLVELLPEHLRFGRSDEQRRLSLPPLLVLRRRIRLVRRRRIRLVLRRHFRPVRAAQTRNLVRRRHRTAALRILRVVSTGRRRLSKLYRQ